MGAVVEAKRGVRTRKIANVEKRTGNNGHALSRDLQVTQVKIDELGPLGRTSRNHPAKQVEKLSAGILKHGFVLPILIDAQRRIVDGAGLVQAARKLGISAVPAITVTDLTDAELRGLRLLLNRVAEDASWDASELRLELNEIVNLDPELDLGLTGFDTGEIDFYLGTDAADEEDELPNVGSVEPVTKVNDVWQCGPHRIICADALNADSYAMLMEGGLARSAIIDLPYNVPIEGHASGLGATKHPDFASASGEMSEAEFTAFLATGLTQAAQFSEDGSIHFLFMDWRSCALLQTVAMPIYSELKNICVWNKSNAGMGSLYRSQHEFVHVYKVGRASHVNNVALGKGGRYRTNVWSYPSQAALGPRKSKLALHPTAKPVALVADAIRDCSHRGDLILDSFGGIGTTLIAAEKTGRHARLIEIEPRYVDITVRRWQAVTGGVAVHAASGQPFAEAEREAIVTAD